MPNTIRLKDYGHVKEEYPASAAITPGEFLALAGNMTVGAAGADHQGPLMVAVEDEFQGKAITDDYASGAIVQCWLPGPGDKVYAIAGAAVAAGALIELGAGGEVITLSTGSAVGQALEAAAAQGDRIAIRVK